MSKGENWIKLLRGYGPVPGNNATEAENVDSHTKPLGIDRLVFTHPAREQLDQWFLNASQQSRPTILITGTAGDGKTTLCYDIIKDLTGTAPAPASKEGIETFSLPGGGNLDLIRDLTGWRKRDSNNRLIPEQVDILERIASHAKSGSHYPTIIAVNDGQIHEVFRALPNVISHDLREFFEEAIQLHAKGISQSPALANFRLVDLSMITSEVLMRACITAVISRPEWKCLEDESTDPLFAPESPLTANFQILSSEATQNRLFDIARLADACQFHLPIRSILMLLSNALLGHPGAPEGLLKPNTATRQLLKSSSEGRAEGAFHRNLFGYNLGPIRRRKHNVYRFLASLEIGSETTNDIDELLIFGDRDQPEVKALYAAIVAHDPHHQRCRRLQDRISRYIRGEINDSTDLNEFLDNLADERRRVFFHADDTCMRDNNLWRIAAFHHAGTYIHDYLVPLRGGRAIPNVKLNPIITGLNRIWTGMYIASTEQELVLASGLDMTTSPVSDILLELLSKSSIKLEPSPAQLPKLVITLGNRRFEMIITLMRFEFIQRAAEGAMPGSFSREAREDLMSLKQKALRDLNVRARPNELFRLMIGEAGRVLKTHIQLEH
ncbi:MAG: hypothetical protein KA004_12910 [Verrucomicrobiales bacterium]|nr:hypothetical protein [Verrucomicrobiales bacterium]